MIGGWRRNQKVAMVQIPSLDNYEVGFTFEDKEIYL